MKSKKLADNAIDFSDDDSVDDFTFQPNIET